MSREYDIVVARYNEDIQWLAPLADKCVVYNKGQPLGLPGERMRTNVGLESETYLHYVIDNYNNLPDYVVFTQGKISDHRGSDSVDHILQMLEEAKLYGKSVPLVNTATNGDWVWQPDWNRHMQGDYKNNVFIVFEDWFTMHVRPTFPRPMLVYSNALFAVKKELILANSLEYYEKLVQETNHSVKPIEAHFFERSWYYIFQS